MNPVEVALAFFDAINRHDIDRLAGLMTDDHIFIDSLGKSVRGREAMRAGWRGYFAMCPDYWVSHDDIFHSGNIVAAFGSTGGTIRANQELSPENKWQTPAAWSVVVHAGLIQEFRVYADNKPVYDILARGGRPRPSGEAQ
jgi:ketosteroid isomerase-like protein